MRKFRSAALKTTVYDYDANPESLDVNRQRSQRITNEHLLKLLVTLPVLPAGPVHRDCHC